MAQNPSGARSADILIKNQIPRRSADPHRFGSGAFPRRDGLVSSAKPLLIGDIVNTTLGRAQVVAISGTRATLILEYTNASAVVDSTGVSGADYDALR